jgi:hypothetical protein
MKRARKTARVVRRRPKKPPAIDVHETIDVQDTKARFQQQVKQRFRQLEAQLKSTEKFNRAAALAAGIDASKFPQKLRRELKAQAERTLKDKPPPLATE